MTPAGFQNSVRSHLPLTLTDDTVYNLAGGLGWQQSWLKTGPARNPAPQVPASGNIQNMMRAAASGNAAVMHGPVLGAPRHAGMVDPPRPNPEAAVAAVPPVALDLINSDVTFVKCLHLIYLFIRLGFHDTLIIGCSC